MPVLLDWKVAFYQKHQMLSQERLSALILTLTESVDREPLLISEALTLACKSLLQHVKSEQSLEQLCNLLQIIALRCKLNTVIGFDCR